MDLLIDASEFEHIKEMSVYNNNYYRHKKNGYVIYEKCHEDFNYYDFYLIENRKNIFLGRSQNGFDNEKHITIEFKTEY